MPWNQTDPMSERLKMIGEYLSGDYGPAELGRRYGVSRKTIYEWITRYKQEGCEGLKERSSAPHHHPNATEQQVVDELVPGMLADVVREQRHPGLERARAAVREQRRERVVEPGPVLPLVGDQDGADPCREVMVEEAIAAGRDRAVVVHDHAAVEQVVQSYEQDFRRVLREANIPFTDINVLKVDSDVNNGLRVLLPANADLGNVRSVLQKAQPDLACRDAIVTGGSAVDCVMTPQQVRERRDSAITANITTLRNRVNALGVSEPIVQRQGLNRIVVQLAGVQNSAEVKDMRQRKVI